MNEMKRVMTSAIVLLTVARAIAQDKLPAPAPMTKDYYAKVEVKGYLSVNLNSRFDPKMAPSKILSTGDLLYTGPLVGNRLPVYYYELLAEDKRHFDWMRANNGKTVVVTGELELVAVPQPPIPFSSPPHTPDPLIRRVIRVRDIRLAEPK
jgi:hypothetical protein